MLFNEEFLYSYTPDEQKSRSIGTQREVFHLLYSCRCTRPARSALAGTLLSLAQPTGVWTASICSLASTAAPTLPFASSTRLLTKEPLSDCTRTPQTRPSSLQATMASLRSEWQNGILAEWQSEGLNITNWNGLKHQGTVPILSEWRHVRVPCRCLGLLACDWSL